MKLLGILWGILATGLFGLSSGCADNEQGSQDSEHSSETSTETQGGETSDDQPSVTDSESETGETCGDVECDENATCVVDEGEARCRCHDGYLGNGRACDPSAAWTLHVVGEQEKATYIYVADVDGDGDMDIVSVSTEHMTTLESEIAWWRNDGDSWTKIVIDPDGVAVNNANGVVVGDVDGDGRKDIVVAAGGESEGMADKDGGGLYWYRAPSDESGTWTKIAIAHEADDKYWKVYLIDPDHDDDWDIVAGGYRSAVLFVNPGDDPDVPESWTQVPLPSGTGVGINLANMDDDPDLEVISANMDSKKVSWVDIVWTGDSFEFSEHVVDDNVPGAFDTMALDLNGDDRLDLVVSHIMVAGVSWYEAPAEPGGEWIKHIVDEGLRAADVYVGDIDGDGAQDFVLAGYDMGFADQPDQIPWFTMAGQGAAATLKMHFIDFDGLAAPGDISLDDMDGDGDLDLVTTSYADGLVVWYENHLNELP